MSNALTELAPVNAPQGTAASPESTPPTAPLQTAVSSVVVIPTYNERHNISTLIHTIHQTIPDLHVLVVDDNSPDGTADEVRQLQAALGDKISLYSRPQKDGLARAYAAGDRKSVV